MRRDALTDSGKQQIRQALDDTLRHFNVWTEAHDLVGEAILQFQRLGDVDIEAADPKLRSLVMLDQYFLVRFAVLESCDSYERPHLRIHHD